MLSGRGRASQKFQSANQKSIFGYIRNLTAVTEDSESCTEDSISIAVTENSTAVHENSQLRGALGKFMMPYDERKML